MGRTPDPPNGRADPGPSLPTLLTVEGNPFEVERIPGAFPSVRIHLETQGIVPQQLPDQEYAVRGKPLATKRDSQVKPAPSRARPDERAVWRKAGQFEGAVQVDGDVAEGHGWFPGADEPRPVRVPEISGVLPNSNLHSARHPR